MNKTLSVSAIQDGTVIDHITSGNALRIMHLLGLEESRYQITLGLNLISRTMGRKDIIKIESFELMPEQAKEIVVFCPNATINTIKNFTVMQKIKPHLPKSITNVFICPNSFCISHEKNIKSVFSIEEETKKILLNCYYCEKTFDRDGVQVKI